MQNQRMKLAQLSMASGALAAAALRDQSKSMVAEISGLVEHAKKISPESFQINKPAAAESSFSESEQHQESEKKIRDVLRPLNNNKLVKKAFKKIGELRFEGEFGEYKIRYARAHGYDALKQEVKSKGYTVTINNAIRELFLTLDYRLLNNLQKARGEESSRSADDKGWTHMAFREEVIKLLLYWLGHYEFNLSYTEKKDADEIHQKVKEATQSVCDGLNKYIMKNNA